MLFRNVIDHYREQQLTITPLSGKIPIVKGWQENPQHDSDGTGIGLLCGKHSSVVAIDVDDDKLVHLIKEAFHSAYSKVGKKGRTFFYRYNGEKNFTISGLIDFLSDGKQTVLPPSPHPDGGFYQWCEGDLLDNDLQYYLTDLPKNFSKELVESLINPTQQQKSNPAKEGRNNKHVSMIQAALSKCKSITEIAKEVLDFDSKYPNPLFSDKSEPNMRDDPLTNALKMIGRVALSSTTILKKSFLEMGEIPVNEEPTQTEHITYKEVKLPHFRGIAQDIFTHIYDSNNSERSRIAFASTLSTMSLMLANKVHFDGILPNLYTMILAESGVGKRNPMNFPSILLDMAGRSKYMGHTAVNSDLVVIATLSSNNIRIDVIDEADRLFKTSSSTTSHTMNIAKTYTDVFTQAGLKYSGASAVKRIGKDNHKGNIGECYNPYIVLMCAMTIEDFRDTFNSKLMTGGLGGRFLVFPDTEFKRSRKKKKNFLDIPEHIVDYCSSMLTDISGQEEHLPALQHRMAPMLGINDVPISKDAQELLDQIAIQYDDMKEQAKKDNDDILLPFYNRMYELTVKLMIIDTFSVNWKFPIDQVKIKKDNVQWAFDLMKSYTSSAVPFVKDHMVGNHKTIVSSTIAQELKNYPKGIPIAYLARKSSIKKFGLNKDELRKAIEILEVSGTVIKTTESNRGFSVLHSSFYNRKSI